MPTWATDSLYPAGSESFSETDTKTEPSSGKKAEGWEPKERPAAQAMNWWQNLVYQWLVYFDAGIFEGDFTINGNLTVTGTADIGGAAHIGADAQVDGDLKVTGDVGYGTARSKVLSPSDGAYCTLGTGYILGVTKADTSTAGAPAAGSGVYQVVTTSGGVPDVGQCRQHMNLESGSRITKIKVRWEKTSGHDASVGVNLYSIATGSHSNLETFATSGSVGDNVAEFTLASPVTLSAGQDISVDWTGVVGDKMRALQPTWDRPITVTVP